MPSVIDLTGQRFGRLVVVERTENKGVKVQWKCLCDCGRYCSITSDMLLKGKTKSCGCLRKERARSMSENNRKYPTIEVQKSCNQKARRARDKAWLREQKTPCIKCGESRPWVIDFHHVDPKTKSFQVSTVAREKSKATVLEEIKKCVCLCKNCHAEFHYLYGRNPKSPTEDLTNYIGRSWFVV